MGAGKGIRTFGRMYQPAIESSWLDMVQVVWKGGRIVERHVGKRTRKLRNSSIYVLVV